MKGIFEASFEELYSSGLNSGVAENVVSGVYDGGFVDRELEAAEKAGVKVITREDPDYPRLLAEIYCPPPYIYVKGDPACLNEPTIGIVGSRKCTRYGEEFTFKLAADLASVGFTVVSGFAYGADIAAHRGAMTAGRTAAVMGSGFGYVYPKVHLKYVDELASKGCFVTEFPFEEPPAPQNFPRRNRIISGLSLGVVVAEAARKSGSLITARFAQEQNREVFAVPALPGSAHSAGNELIKNGEAKLTETYLDIVQEFAYQLKSSPETGCGVNGENGYEPDTEIKRTVWKALSREPLDADELCSRLDVELMDLLSCTMELEIDGRIARDESGKFFLRRRRNG